MSAKERVLVAEDDANGRKALAELLRDEGYQVETAADGFKALGKLQGFGPDVVLTDLKMPGMSGIELIKKVRERDYMTPVIVMTAFGDVETAVGAMREGASDYLTKPLNFDELKLVIERVTAQRKLEREARVMRQRLSERDRIGNIIGSSEPMRAVADMIRQIAPSRASVLITGESGTGKELVASALHEHSSRAGAPFVRVHCAALAENLLESELFGHERGAFTGAVQRRDGRFQLAHGGTLFLDEIGEIPVSTQVKLLRFLQEREFERVGGNQTIKVDVRVIAATNRDLDEEIRAGRFREDLFYRLNVVTIEMPPLRERPSDIPLLANHFLSRYAAENETSVSGFTPEAADKLAAYPWPGNVRELENAVERAVVMARGAHIEVGDLPVGLRSGQSDGEGGTPAIPGSTLAEVEKYMILKTLEYTGGSTSRAAEMLGISPRKIQYRLREYADAPSSDVDVVD